MADLSLFLFVSHVAENRTSALEIVDELERRGTRCWIAPRDVRPGKPFDDEIADAIEASRAMLLIFSDLCNDSDYIRREVTVAGESRKTIIPFRIENVQPRRGLRVRLSDLHWIDGFVSRERAIDEVIKTFAPLGNGFPRGESAHVLRDDRQPRIEPVQAEPKPADAMIQEPPIIAVTTPIAEAEPSKAETALAPVDTQDDLRGTEPATAAHDPVRGDATIPPDVSHHDADSVSQPQEKPAETPGGHWWVLIGCAILVGMLALGLFIMAPPPSTSALINSGNAYYQKQDYDHAIADYTEAIRLDPKYAIAFLNRGLAYQYGKQGYDRAIADYTEAIRLDPKYADAYSNRGNAYYNGKQDYDRAIADLTEAIRLNPNYLDAYVWRGVVYSVGRQDYARAIADYTQAIRIDPKDATALYYRGLAKQKIGDAKGGAADIASARAIDPNVGK